MKLSNISLLLSLMTDWRTVRSYSASALSSSLSTRHYYCSGHSASILPALSPQQQPKLRTRSLTLQAATEETTEINDTDATTFWQARQDCWRPDVRDVEKISWGMPAKKKRTGSRGVPHRLNEDERRAFDQARRQGFLQVTGSSWRSQRRDAPLLNSYRSLMDARGRPVIVLHKLSPDSSGGDHADRLVVDLSPLRIPGDFETVESELKGRLLAEFGIDCLLESDEEVAEEIIDEVEIAGDNVEDDGEDDWETRPIYQLSPYSVSWNVSRQQGKQAGKLLGNLFNNIEEKAIKKSKKPKGVRPGKGRRHGGYGI